MPVFAQTQKAKLTALVSGSPKKARSLAQQYAVKPESIYDYAGIDHICGNPDVAGGLRRSAEQHARRIHDPRGGPLSWTCFAERRLRNAAQ